MDREQSAFEPPGKVVYHVKGYTQWMGTCKIHFYADCYHITKSRSNGPVGDMAGIFVEVGWEIYDDSPQRVFCKLCIARRRREIREAAAGKSKKKSKASDMKIQYLREDVYQFVKSASVTCATLLFLAGSILFGTSTAICSPAALSPATGSPEDRRNILPHGSILPQARAGCSSRPVRPLSSLGGLSDST